MIQHCYILSPDLAQRFSAQNKCGEFSNPRLPRTTRPLLAWEHAPYWWEKVKKLGETAKIKILRAKQAER